MSEANKTLARRAWDEIFNQRNLDFFDAVRVADAIWHEPEREYQGTEELKQVTAGFLEAFPDLNVTVEDVLAEGEQIAIRWTQRGTHQGEMEGLDPPTGRSFELEGITIHRFEDDKLAKTWESYDNLSLLRQLGLAQDSSKSPEVIAWHHDDVRERIGGVLPCLHYRGNLLAKPKTTRSIQRCSHACR